MTTVLEISAESAKVSVSKGFLLICRDDVEDKIPLADIESIIVNSHGLLFSNHAIMRIAELGIPIVHCSTNAMPCALTLPYGTNVYRKTRIKLQLTASLPLYKNLWQQVIKAKILNQAKVLMFAGKNFKDLTIMASKVGSGDPGNLEAVAARAYWERLFGRGFKRNPDLEGINSYLNYGYAILRASFCRNIVASGLIPEIGIHHHNQMNPYCLADDLMEPYRPFVDLVVCNLGLKLDAPLTIAGKKTLISILHLRVKFQDKSTHLRFSVGELIQLFIRSLENKKPLLGYPTMDSEVRDALKELMIDNKG